MGTVSDRIGRRLAPIICALLQAGAMLWLIWARELWMLYLFAIVYGFAYAGLGSTVGALIGDIFELSRIGAIFGVLEIGFGVGAAIGPVLGGFIFDFRQSYSLAFLIGTLTILAIALLLTLIKPKALSHQ